MKQTPDEKWTARLNGRRVTASTGWRLWLDNALAKKRQGVSVEDWAKKVQKPCEEPNQVFWCSIVFLMLVAFVMWLVGLGLSWLGWPRVAWAFGGFIVGSLALVLLAAFVETAVMGWYARHRATAPAATTQQVNQALERRPHWEAAVTRWLSQGPLRTGDALFLIKADETLTNLAKAEATRERNRVDREAEHRRMQECMAEGPLARAQAAALQSRLNANLEPASAVSNRPRL